MTMSEDMSVRRVKVAWIEGRIKGHRWWVGGGGGIVTDGRRKIGVKRWRVGVWRRGGGKTVRSVASRARSSGV